MPLRVAVVGLGYWGKHYLRITTQSPACTLVAMCDAWEEALKRHGPSYPEVKQCTSVDQLLELNLDAVVVATQASYHYDVVKKLLAGGVSVLVEKPLTVLLEHAEDLMKTAEEHKVTLMVAHTFLFNSSVLKMKEEITEGVAGTLYNLYATRTNMGPFRKDVNAIWDLAPHDVSIFNYLLDGPPEWVSANGSKPLKTGLEDVGFITCGYKNDVLGHIHVSWADPRKVRDVTVVGSKARINFNDMDAGQSVKIYMKSVSNETQEGGDSYGEHNLVVRDGDILIPAFPMKEPLSTQFAFFLERVSAKDIKQFRSDAQFGVDVVRTMVAIDESIKNDGKRVYLSKK